MTRWLLFILLTFYSSGVFAWGTLGHRIVGQIAYNHLSETAKVQVAKIMETESLAKASNWPDFIRSAPEQWRYTFPWHYVSIDKKNYKESPKNKDGDIVFAMIRCEELLRDPHQPKNVRRNALAFLVHFVGDIHQPFHAGYSKDKGGNTINLKWFGQKTNLHKVWDEDLIELQKLSYSEYVDFIDHASDSDQKKWITSTYEDWANESRNLMVDLYPPKQTKYWEFNYNYKHKALLESRLLQAGIRLADVIDRAVLNKPYFASLKKLRDRVHKDYSQLANAPFAH